MNDEIDNKFDDDLLIAAAKLPTDVKPGRDLWPDIQQAIDVPAVRERSSWNTVWLQAAAVLLLVGGSSVLTYLVTSSGNDIVTPVGNNGVGLVFAPVSGSFGGEYHLGPDYQDAKRVLEVRLDTELAQMSPDVRDAVQTNLDSIRMAINDINKALAEEPGNVLLQKLLQSTYKEELALMQHVDGIASKAMYRGDI